MAVIYIDEEHGVDGTQAHGTKASPFRSLAQAFVKHGSDNEYRVKKKGDEEFKLAAKAALKKAVSYADTQRKKREASARRAGKEEQETAAVEATLVAAQNIHIAEDPALPEAMLIDLAETDPRLFGRLRKSQDEPPQGESVRRVRVQGRVYRVAKQGGLMFVTLRRGLSLMQCLLSGQLTKTHDALTLARETSMEISGELWEVPPCLHAPLSQELHADYFRIIAKAPGGDESFTNRVPEDGDPNTLLNLRHLTLRHDKPAAVMFVRDALENAFHVAYKERNIKKVSPPALVQTQVEDVLVKMVFHRFQQLPAEIRLQIWECALDEALHNDGLLTDKQKPVCYMIVPKGSPESSNPRTKLVTFEDVSLGHVCCESREVLRRSGRLHNARDYIPSTDVVYTDDFYDSPLVPYSSIAEVRHVAVTASFCYRLSLRTQATFRGDHDPSRMSLVYHFSDTFLCLPKLESITVILQPLEKSMPYYADHSPTVVRPSFLRIVPNSEVQRIRIGGPYTFKTSLERCVNTKRQRLGSFIKDSGELWNLLRGTSSGRNMTVQTGVLQYVEKTSEGTRRLSSTYKEADGLKETQSAEQD